MKMWLALLSLIPVLWVQGQKVQLIVPEVPVPLGTAFQVQYVVVNAGNLTSTSTPSFTDLKVVSGPNRYKGQMLVDGKMLPVENITYTVVPTKLGKLEVGSITASFKDGADISSSAASVTVKQPPKASFNTQSNFTDVSLYAAPSSSNLQKIIDDNLFIRVEVSKNACYVGEPVEATFKLYSRLQSTSEVVNSPSLYGFSVMDVLDIHTAHHSVETIAGKVFNTSILRKIQLYPEQPGTLTIDEMELHNTIEFDDSVNRNHKTVIEKRLLSKPVQITVKPLPQKKPLGHTGAVGRYTISSSISKELISGREGTLVVTISGKGNFIQFSAPSVSWPKEFEVFDPKIADSFNKEASPVEGKREYHFGFTVDSIGAFTIPAVNFVFFDPDSGRFKTLVTEPMDITVLPARKETGPLKDGGNGSSGSGFWVLTVITVALLSLAAFLFFRKKQKVEPVISTIVKKTLKDQLEEINVGALTDKEACFEIQQILSAIANEYGELTTAQKTTIADIRNDCILMVYSNVHEVGKKHELKKRTLHLLSELEPAHSAYL